MLQHDKRFTKLRIMVAIQFLDKCGFIAFIRETKFRQKICGWLCELVISVIVLV